MAEFCGLRTAPIGPPPVFSGGSIAPTTTAHLQGAPDGTGTFTITGASSRALFGVVGVSLAVGEDDEDVSLRVKYEGHFGVGAMQHGGLINASYQW